MSYAHCFLCMPTVAEKSGLLVSDIGPRRCPIFCLHALFAIAGELMLGTIRRCGRSGILAAHFTFFPRLIGILARATLLYIRRVIWNMVLFYFGLNCHFPLCVVDPSSSVDYHACACVQVSSGSSTVVASISCASPPGRLSIAIPLAIQGF